MSEHTRHDKYVATGTILLVLGLFPIWRCGLRSGLNFYQFVQEHTIWGHEVVYIPVENLTEGEIEDILAHNGILADGRIAVLV